LKVYDEDPGRVDPVKRHQNWPGWSFAPRFLTLATDYPDDPAAVDALLWVGRLGEAVNENYPSLEFGDLKSPRRGQPLAEIARSALHELHDLSLGRIAPEIDGRDADGVAFKLSDYRGKVVVLTFSGNWCGPCRGMYPAERELVKRLEGKRFALLSVNTDGDRETLRKSIQSGEITWRCWWDGSPEGPICRNWNVTLFPTIYMLDGGGAIRFKNVHGPSLDEAVKKLLKDLEASPSTP
jgi:thiol-disulfide isomerase/thioredoxin